tara:strand:+ start:3185 stop:3349 length:165 start_codon:yes stop_codon:yes gene_type:complete
VGTKVQALDYQQKWYDAVIALWTPSFVKIHFVGWNKAYDERHRANDGSVRIAAS